MNRTHTAISGVMVLFAVAAAVAVGPGCAPLPVVSVTYCCTRGDSGSAYYTASQDCPAGFRCIASNDAPNARLFATCSAPKPTATPVPPPVRSCFTECPPGVNNAHCVFSGPVAAAYAGPLAQIVDTLTRERSARIEPGGLAQSFRLAPALVQRGPILLQNERVSNSGNPVVMEAAAPALGGVARLEIPPNVDATVERRGPVTIFRLPQTAANLSLRLRNPATRAPLPMDGTAGGRVLAIETNGQAIFVQTAGACLVTTLPAAR